ncbi:AzlC family ABC transporter permease [Halanaerobium sp. MA284_MarDTE_T2]|uniref:AzlC family ABC transporter permease n=1 Tax=Halanaerobium sp. MA284_MarDTE_T2 TaxID=2183913 RepID=UPI000E15230A|nr:AzlC family ABC transporter permease [Halanaerobium sp. MA284_MarDTE_T2]RCW50677.1 4-azaleucine resistance transporter AzlC [Halanaerobium sp. MA284_MarDTE_T2]
MRLIPDSLIKKEKDDNLMFESSRESRIKDFKFGIKSALPIILGYLPIGTAYGILAVNKGIKPVYAVFMSVFVFAGSSQLVALEMIASNAAILAIVAMTFLVNLRHVLLSASLSLHLKNLPSFWYPILGFFITDEAFAVAMAEFDNVDHKKEYYLALGIFSYLGWVFSSAFGAFLSEFINFKSGGALDFVLPAMFIVLLLIQISGRKDLFVAFTAAVLSLFFAVVIGGSWNIILAAGLAALLGVYMDGGE